MKIIICLCLVFCSASLHAQSQTIDDAIKKGPLLDAPGSQTPIGKPKETTYIIEEQHQSQLETLKETVESLNKENSNLKAQIQKLQDQIKAMKASPTVSERRIIRKKTEQDAAANP